MAYSTNPQEAEDMKRRLAAAVPDVNIYLTRFGPVIGVHAGPGVLAVAVLEGEE